MDELGIFTTQPTAQLLDGILFVDWQFFGFKIGFTFGPGEDECGWWIFNGVTSHRGKWPFRVQVSPPSRTVGVVN